MTAGAAAAADTEDADVEAESEAARSPLRPLSPLETTLADWERNSDVLAKGVFLFAPEDVEHVLVTNVKNYQRKEARSYKPLKQFLGAGLGLGLDLARRVRHTDRALAVGWCVGGSLAAKARSTFSPLSARNTPA